MSEKLGQSGEQRGAQHKWLCFVRWDLQGQRPHLGPQVWEALVQDRGSKEEERGCVGGGAWVGEGPGRVQRLGKPRPQPSPAGESRGKVARGRGSPRWGEGGGPRVTGDLFRPLEQLPFPLLSSLPIPTAPGQTTNVASINTSCLSLQL